MTMNPDLLQHFLEETPLLNIHDATLFSLNEKHKWDKEAPELRIKNIYEFVRDSIAYAFPKKCFQPASDVLAEGRGMSVSKSILLMALLRQVHIPCRFHGFLIKKEFLRGIPDDKVYKKIPPLLVHAWVEVLYEERWIIMEGATLPKSFIEAQVKKIPFGTGEFNGLGIGVHELDHLRYEWTGKHTYIQRNAVLRDYSVFNSPGDFHLLFGKELKKLRTYYPKGRVLKRLNKSLELQNQR
jgi:hypothetical protein